MRCYKCQTFGHTKFNCRKNEVCTKCGQEDHTDSQECKNEAKCVNCQGNQASNEKECPKWKEEKEIQRIKAERGISYIVAKKEMDIFSSVKTTYAQAAAEPKPLFIYLGFYVAFNTVQVISRRVVGRAEETSTYSLLGFCTVIYRPTASNYQLSRLRP